MNNISLPIWATVLLTILFNGLYAVLKVFQTNIDVQTFVLLNAILGYAVLQLHINVVNTSVAQAKEELIHSQTQTFVGASPLGMQ